MPSFAALIAITNILPSVSALVAASSAHSYDLFQRDASVCGGNPSLNQCGGSFPTDFCCPSTSKCMALNSTASIAVLCCPTGSDCAYIRPISCDQSAQNATYNPSAELHSEPPLELATCGNACCPMGATCVNGQCAVQPTAAKATTSSTSTATSTSSTTSSTTSTASQSATGAAGMPLVGNPQSPIVTTVPSGMNDFNGSSFAAGFIPGIFLGGLLIGLLLWYLSRRRKSRPYFDEKNLSRDQLTDLSTISGHRPNMHERSISEPTIDPTGVHRTDFLRGTPPRLVEQPANTSYSVSASGPTPVTPSRTPRAVRALFTGSRSPLFPSANPSTPIPTQAPLAAHLKRGTLSFTISPIRTLRTKKSMHSLRRQMTSTSRGSSQRRADVSRSGSTETIQVLMPSNEPYTPDQRPFTNQDNEAQQSAPLSSRRYYAQAQPSSTAPTWRSPNYGPQPTAPQQQSGASYSKYPVPSSIYSPPQQFATPTRDPIAPNNQPNTLGTPYTPSQFNGAGKVTGVMLTDDGGLRVERETRERPTTTFSGLMEKSGLRQEDFIGGYNNGGARR